MFIHSEEAAAVGIAVAIGIHGDVGKLLEHLHGLGITDGEASACNGCTGILILLGN